MLIYYSSHLFDIPKIISSKYDCFTWTRCSHNSHLHWFTGEDRCLLDGCTTSKREHKINGVAVLKSSGLHYWKLLNKDLTLWAIIIWVNFQFYHTDFTQVISSIPVSVYFYRLFLFYFFRTVLAVLFLNMNSKHFAIVLFDKHILLWCQEDQREEDKRQATKLMLP